MLRPVTHLPLVLFAVLFAVAFFGPLRWSIVAFLLLSNIDLGSQDASIGLLNTAKAVVLPLFLLWRLRRFTGHSEIRLAPIAWGLLTLYVIIASSWSLFPMYAIKLVGHMIGSLIICLMLMKATKGGYLSFDVIVPVSVGVVALAALHWFLLPNWGGEPGRFTSFSTAQAFAAFVTALYCAVVGNRSFRMPLRLSLCLLLAATVSLDGSRIWITGLVIATLLAIFVSQIQSWVKILVLGLTVMAGTVAVGEFDSVMSSLASSAGSNRIAAALSAAYLGDIRSTGLGTYNFRHELFLRSLEAIADSSPEELLFGHGTSNGFLIAVTLNKEADPNRALHDEWLRALYEWGITGLLLWLFFIASLFAYAAREIRRDPTGYASPLLIYLPAFVLGLTGENILAGAGNAVTVGLLMLIAFASIAQRRARYQRPMRASAWKGGSLAPAR